MKNQKIIASLLVIGLIIAYMSARSGQEPVSHAQLDPKLDKSTSANYHDMLKDAGRQLSLDENIYLISAATEELTGDNTMDSVLLAGIKVAGDDSIAEDIDVIIRDGKSGQFSSAGLRGLSSSQAGLFFGDYNSDSVKDVLVTAPAQGSNLQHAIVSFAADQPKILFNGSSTSHEFASKQMKSPYASVSYPQFEAASTAGHEFVNQTLQAAASEILNRATTDRPISVSYTISRSDSSLVSVVFNDEQNPEKPILQTVTINLRGRRTISLDNLLTAERQIRQNAEALIDTAAKAANISTVPKLDEWTNFYLTENELVFYQQKADKAPLILKLPLDKARSLLVRSARG